MKTFSLVLCAALAATAAAPAAADDAVEAAKTCLADSTTGKDRKVLGKWVFLAIAAHPEIGALAPVTQEQVDQSNREFATLFTRLVTEDCQPQMRAMLASSGSDGVGVAFQYLGQIAMQELMSHPAVTTRIGEFEKHVDQAKLQAAFSP